MNTMNTITLTNTFHKTSMKIRSESAPDMALYDLEFEAYQESIDMRKGPATRKLARIKAALCGIPGCQCSPFIKAE